mgnify:CR=1 FL=1
MFNFSRMYDGLLGSSKEKRVIITNFYSLGLLQIANYIFPLVTLPYLVRVLGVERYGLIAFAQAFTQYFVVLTDYGFQLSGTREVSLFRLDNNKISRIFSSITVVKGIILIFCFILLLFLVFLVPRFREERLVYIFAFGMVFDSVLFPVWLFQGMEEMRYITVRNIVAKVIFTIAIFVLIKEESDYVYVLLVNSLGLIISGLISLRIMTKRFNIVFKFPDFSQISLQVKEGWHIFLSKMAINLYTSSNTFILGLFTDNTLVGYYAAGEKIVRTIIAMFNPVFQSLFPFFTKSAVVSEAKTARRLMKILKITFFVSMPLTILLFTSAGSVVNAFLGEEFGPTVFVLRILSPLVFVVPASSIFANLGLLSFKFDRYLSKIYLGGALLNVILLFFFLGVLNLKIFGAAIVCLCVELTLTVAMILKLNSRHSLQLA